MFKEKKQLNSYSSIKDDSTWLELQLNPEKANEIYNISLPGLPPDDVQMRFTGLTGLQNLEQAFHFYKHSVLLSNLKQIDNPKILDFGGGWGRVSRFFLRETSPQNIWIVDCLTDSIKWLKETQNPCNVIQNSPSPPIEGLEADFDLIYAYSVFSHLSEEYFQRWVSYFMSLLKPEGYLVFTTRGRDFIGHLEYLHQSGSKSYLVQNLPHPSHILDRYEKGEFQFYPCAGGGELTDNFYGEAFIPKQYMKEHYPAYLVDFADNITWQEQNIVTLRKPSS
jgi:2-polyprenyl-3-methyl-5-hydroxy-6-metoxy-1,4-benzoquinol methylase